MGIWRRSSLPPGIYDELISDELAARIDALDPGLQALVRPVGEKEDVTPPLAALLRDAVDRALDSVSTKPELSRSLVEAVLMTLRMHAPKEFDQEAELRLRSDRLSAIVRHPALDLARPRGSLHVSRLLANAPGDALIDHLRSEFDSADRVDLLCAFVKLSGFEKLRAVLEGHTSGRARPLRVLTTTYMGASELKAIERFAALPGAEVKVSFDETVTRLHAKAWIFHRGSGYSTAYVGSSNLSHAAQTDGLEWNVRATESDQPVLVAQMTETFEQYWADAHQFERFVPGDEGQRRRLARALSTRVASSDGLLLEIEPKDYQKPVLDELVEARALGRHRNLMVAATGTGKTVMAALDYRRLAADGRVQTLLFVAHRREILEQSRRVFRAAMQVQTFGELLCEGERPVVGRHVFASIDSLGPDATIDPAQFDMVVLDEAHHTAADTWTRLLDRVRPKELLGLTGTPERTDGLEYERHFPRPWVGNLRVWNAIPHALVPFRYYALDVDGVDLSQVGWRGGRYVAEELDGKLIGASQIFVHRAVVAIAEHVARPDDLRAIAFCASVRHAHEVHLRFEERGFRSQVLTGTTPADVRRAAQTSLNGGGLQILCVVDLYNEGVDVPNVNTLFFFRPTESATVFLQQLGRGLRRAPSKSELVVFDLTGRQHRQFRFDRRLRALLGHTPRELREFVDGGFGRLPAGCHMRFDERAREAVLEQIRRAIPGDLRGIQTLMREPANVGLSLAEFLHETDVALEDIYAARRCWTLVRRAVVADERTLADLEEDALKAVHKLIYVGDVLRLDQWARLLDQKRPTTEVERRLTRMLFSVVYGKTVASDDDLAWSLWVRHPVLREELAALLPVLQTRNATLSPDHHVEADVPLVLHGRYLGVELSAAFDQRSADGVFRDYYTGVERTPGERFDLLLVTLEKSAATKEHLRYRDFPLNEDEFHWQSKSRTRRTSREGRRHLQPDVEGCMSLLLVREAADDPSRAGVTMPFCFLGPVTPCGDEGERPITVTWRLRYPMPRALLSSGRVAA